MEAKVVSKTERFEMRVDEEIMQRIDRWREDQDDTPSRAEATRRLIEEGLARAPGEVVHFSDGEKLLLVMVGDLYRHLKIKQPEIDPDFVGEVISGGHYWAPRWRWPGLYHGEDDSPRDLHEVVEVLDMWRTIERGYGALTKKERTQLEKDAEPFGRRVQFPGFDGNNEATHLSIAHFLVEQMDRFTELAGRDLNSHMPSLPMYRRMLQVYKPIGEGMYRGVTRDNLTLAELTKILRTQRYSD
jgi:uncharacterized protein YfbU (UPF0304 family)